MYALACRWESVGWHPVSQLTLTSNEATPQPQPPNQTKTPPKTQTKPTETHHADDRVKLAGRQAKARHDAADRRVAAGDKGVGAKVDVEHRRVGALDEDALAGVVGLVDVP